MMVGDSIFLDVMDVKTGEHVESIEEKAFRAYSFNWPYLVFGSKDNYIFVVNAFDPN